MPQEEQQHDWVARARALRPLLEAAAPRIEAACALPPDVLDALHAQKMFRMLLPRSLDGGEVEPATFFKAICELAAGDASTAWCIVQNSGCSTSAAYLSSEDAREIFGDPRAVLAWGFPFGQCLAVPVEGGWKVNGTWGFGSGNRHSSWLGGHCVQADAAGVPRKHDDGRPMDRTMLFPRSQATIKGDGWDVIGLRGTGSDTYLVKDLFVPAGHGIVARATGRDQYFPDASPDRVETERREKGILYRFTATNAYQCGFAGVSLGIARATLDAFIALATKKTSASSPVALRDDQWIQSRVATAEAGISSSRAWILQVLRDMWEEAAGKGRISFDQRIKLRLAATYAIHQAREVVETVYADAGATAIFQNNPYERRVRDIHAAAQQVQGSAAHFQSVGQYILGGKPNLRFI